MEVGCGDGRQGCGCRCGNRCGGQVESAGIVLDFRPDIAEEPAVKVGDALRRTSHHDGRAVVWEPPWWEAIAFAFSAVEVRQTKAVTEFMFQNVQVCAVQHIQVSIIRQPLPPVTAASADGREALCCPEVHIEPFARIDIIGIHEVHHPGEFGRCTRQLVRNGFIAVGGVIGAVVVANQGVIDDFIRLQGFFGVLSC